MKVLMFGWEFPPFISGGLGTACFGLTKGLRNHNVEVTFVLPKLHGRSEHSHVTIVEASEKMLTLASQKNGKLKKLFKLLEVDSPLTPYLTEKAYLSIKEEWEEKKRELTVSGDFSGHYGPDIMSEIARYAVIGGAIAEEESFDVVHAHDWMTYLAGIEAKKSSGKPLIVHVHSLEFDRSGTHVNQRVYDIERHGMESADLIIAVSYYTKDLIVKHYGISPEKIRVVHNAVDKEKAIETMHLQKKENEKTVLFLGRITFQKGPDYFIEAAKKVIDRIPNVRFVMAGKGDMLLRMIERMAELRLGKYFHFTGFLTGKDVETMYALSDLYVMPSVSEPFGITPLEAMFYDIPVIISKQSGVAEILTHAIKLDFWDVDALAESIISILTRPEVATAQIEGNREQLKGIHWEIAAEKVLAAYEEVTERE